jgi:hypothetical protein
MVAMMNLEQLDAIDTNNPAQVKQLQDLLKKRGLYTGAIDGKWGGGTTDAAKALRAELGQADEARARAREADVKISENTRIANDPGNAAIRGATEIAPYAAGAGIGAGVGVAGARGLSAMDARQADAVRRLAQNLAISGPVAEQQMTRMAGPRNLRTGAQFLAPAAMLGSAEYIRSNIAPKFDDPETRKWVNLGANADQGAGLGLLAHQLVDLKNRIGSPNDPEAEAMIRTRALPPESRPALAQPETIDITPERAPPAAIVAPAALPPPEADVPPAAPPTRQHSERVIGAARAAGASGPLTKETAAEFLKANLTADNRSAVARELGVKPGPNFVSRISSTLKTMASTRGASALAGPAAAAAMALAVSPNEARAADGSEGGGTADTLTRAGTAAGVAAGANKAMSYVSPLARGLLGAAGEIAGPLSVLSAPEPPADVTSGYRKAILPRIGMGGLLTDAERQEVDAAPAMQGIQGGTETGYAAPPTPGLAPDQMSLLAQALASQGVAGRNKAFPAAEEDPQRRKLAEALMSNY